MTAKSSPTARSVDDMRLVDPSTAREEARDHLATAIAILRETDDAALHTLAGRLDAELGDLTFQCGCDVRA
jgi:hypothetical protein